MFLFRSILFGVGVFRSLLERCHAITVSVMDVLLGKAGVCVIDEKGGNMIVHVK